MTSVLLYQRYRKDINKELISTINRIMTVDIDDSTCLTLYVELLTQKF